MFQFSLKTLFIVTTAFAVLVWILFVPPEWLGVLVLGGIYTLLPCANLAGLHYHRGAWQAFFVGTAPLVAIMTWLTIGGMGSPRFFSASSMDALQIKLLLIFLRGSGQASATQASSASSRRTCGTSTISGLGRMAIRAWG